MGIFTRKIRTHPSQNIDWSSYYGVSKSVSGATVNESTVMGLPAVWCGVNFISTTKAALPLHVFRKTKLGREVAVGHPVEKILTIQPNKHQDPFKFIETCCNYELLTGHVYIEKGYNQNTGVLEELYPLPTWAVDKKKDDETGEFYYVISLKNGKTAILLEDQMLHIEGPFGGACILNLLKESFGLTISIDQFAANFFGRGANPGIVIKHPGNFGPDAHKKLQGSLRDKYDGLGGQFRLMLLDEGMEAQKLLHSLEENQLVGLKQFQIADVARILNLPPHVLKDLTKSSFSNITHQGIELVVYSLYPRVKRYESVFNTFLIPPKDVGKYYVKFNLKGLLRGDDAARATFYTKMMRLGIYCINDVRHLEDENSIGVIGDKHYISADMILLENLGKSKTEKTLLLEEFSDRLLTEDTWTDNKRTEYLPLAAEAIQGVVNREVAAIRKNLKQKDFSGWVNEFYQTIPDVLRKKTNTTFNSLIAAASRNLPGENIKSETQDIIRTFEAEYVQTSLIDAENGLDLDSWHESRAGIEAEKIIDAILQAVSGGKHG